MSEADNRKIWNIQFQKRLLYFLEHWMIDKVQNPANSEEFQSLAPTMIFCNVNTFLLSGELPQKIIPYCTREWKMVK